MQYKIKAYEKARWISRCVFDSVKRLQSQQALLQNCQRQEKAEVLQ
jgi:hypothetical protein